MKTLRIIAILMLGASAQAFIMSLAIGLDIAWTVPPLLIGWLCVLLND